MSATALQVACTWHIRCHHRRGDVLGMVGGAPMGVGGGRLDRGNHSNALLLHPIGWQDSKLQAAFFSRQGNNIKSKIMMRSHAHCASAGTWPPHIIHTVHPAPSSAWASCPGRVLQLQLLLGRSRAQELRSGMHTCKYGIPTVKSKRPAQAKPTSARHMPSPQTIGVGVTRPAVNARRARARCLAVVCSAARVTRHPRPRPRPRQL